MVVALWVLSSLLGLLLGFSLIDGHDAIRFSRITGPVQFALVGALVVVLTALCRRLSPKVDEPDQPPSSSDHPHEQ
jgi:hypothetical protein